VNRRGSAKNVACLGEYESRGRQSRTLASRVGAAHPKAAGSKLYFSDRRNDRTGALAPSDRDFPTTFRAEDRPRSARHLDDFMGRDCLY
jgi:hypothetical protein